MHRDLVGAMFVRGRIFFQALTFYQLVGIFESIESYSFFLTKYEFNLINEQNFNVQVKNFNKIVIRRVDRDVT